MRNQKLSRPRDRRILQTVPDGLRYVADFLSEAEQQELVEQIQNLPFNEVKMHGVVAKRRVAHFGWLYGYESWKLSPGPPVPDFLLPLKVKAASLVNLNPNEFAEALVTQYPPGAGIGWHRDAPMFGPIVVGVSLCSACRMRFRRETTTGRESCAVILEPRSAYVLSGLARSIWQHSISATPALRYSVTFRAVGGRGRSD